MNMVFTNVTFQYLYFQRCTRLANQVSNTSRYRACEKRLTILGNPYKMQLDVKLAMKCAAVTIIDYNGREILVAERFADVVQTIAAEITASFWHDNAKYILPEKLQQLSKQIKIIQDAEPKVVSRMDSLDQCESKEMVFRQPE